MQTTAASCRRHPTHYGQVCCYDVKGRLQQTTYQPVLKVVENFHYNPGFPLRAYEFGASPYLGQFEVPGLSAFHHDYMCVRAIVAQARGSHCSRLLGHIISAANMQSFAAKCKSSIDLDRWPRACRASGFIGVGHQAAANSTFIAK